MVHPVPLRRPGEPSRSAAALETMREQYSYRIQFRSRESYVLWFANDPDGIATDDVGRILSFDSHDAVCSYAERNALGVVLESEAGLNLDVVAAWCEQSQPAAVDCHTFLDAWNLFGDVSASTRGGGIGFVGGESQYTPVYDKLVFGCNLPALMGAGEPYHPRWSSDEISRLRTVLRSGLAGFAAHLSDSRPN